MEANYFRFLATELGSALLGRRIDKVFAPTPGVWTLTMQSTGVQLHVLFRSAKTAGHLFLCPVKPSNPKTAPAIAMWFRKRLRNRCVLGWTMDWPALTLALELTPRHDPPSGRYLLLDVRNGMRLVDELEPAFGTGPDWPALEDVLDDPEIWREYPHISPSLRKRLTNLPPGEALELYLNVAAGAASTFHLCTEDGALHPPQAWPCDGEQESFCSALEAANAYGQRTLFTFLEMEEERPEQTQIKRERKKIVRNLARLDQEEARLQALADEKELGEALQAEMYRLKDMQGLEEVTAVHPRRGPLTVPLNPHLNPVENMAHYFKRAAKAQRGFPHIRRRRDELTAQLDGLDKGIHPVTPRADQPSIPLPDGPAPLPKRYQGLAVTLFRSSDGFTLVRGKNKRANHDMLSRAASPFDYWFHVADGPSSHVILKRDHPGRDVPDRTLTEAAMLCGIKSYRRDDGKAEIMYALVKDVRKVKGFAHGQVAVDKKIGTLRVELDPDIEAKLT
jgi:predicted ribosome quality control (RQC) complex YloA/Tae2 family protein